MDLSSWRLSIRPHDSGGVRVSLSSDFHLLAASDELAALVAALRPGADNPIHAVFSMAAGNGCWFDACVGALESSSGGAFTIEFELPLVKELAP